MSPRTKSVLELSDKFDNIVIVGMPGTGKTTLSNKFNNKEREIIHSDDYIYDISWKDTPYFFMDLLSEHKKYVIEGCGCFRLLSYGLREGLYEPDLVIYIRGNGVIMPKHEVFVRTLFSAWHEFIDMNHANSYPVEIIEW